MLRQLLREMMIRDMDHTDTIYFDIHIALREIEKRHTNQQKPIKDWSFVREFLGKMEQLRKNSEGVHFVFEVILCLFNTFRCKDFSVIADLLQLECFVFDYSASSFRKARLLTEAMRTNSTCIHTNGLNFVANLLRAPYKINTSPYVSFYDVIQMYVVSTEFKLLERLLEYGVMYILLNDHRSTWAHCRQRMNILLNDTDRPLLLNTRTIQANFAELSSERRRRMLAVFRAVEIILKARVPENRFDVPDFQRCFRIAYETIPEPVITSEEVAEFLKLVLSGPSADSLIQAIKKDYEKLFKESLEPRTPRDLLHLSRCQVRQNLRQAGTYPYGILDLKVPKSIHMYIYTVRND